MSSSPRPKNYLNNDQLIVEIEKSRERFQRGHNKKRTPAESLTPELVNMLVLLVDKYASRWNWRGYSFIEDMKSEALLSLCQNALKFNPEKSDNGFGYYTQIIKYAFLTYMDREGKQSKIRDQIAISIPDSDFETGEMRKHEVQTNQLNVDLDGTKAIKADPKKFRRRPPRREETITNIDNPPEENISETAEE